MEIAYIGLGSNLDNPTRQLERAVSALRTIDQTQFLRSSRLYRSSPWGMTNQPDFVNAVAEICTALTPNLFLAALLAIEQNFGRVRTNNRWGPRILDLDLLLYGDHVIDELNLRVPHPYIHERSFVLLPLYELVPNLEIPGRGCISSLLGNTKTFDCTPLSD